MTIFLLLTMIFMHIIDDYYLQGILASLKQKKWWEENANDKMYKNDYLMALFMHSFSWTFMITLPYHIYILIFGGTFYPIIFLFNLLMHMFIDNAKANWKKFNLIQDQILHLGQIIVTWCVFCF